MSVRELLLGFLLAAAMGCVTAGVAVLAGPGVALIVGGMLGAVLSVLVLGEVG